VKLLLRCARALEKRIEDVFLLIRRNSRPPVAYANLDSLRLVTGGLRGKNADSVASLVCSIAGSIARPII
jgi:hypothetical protein